MPLGYNDFERLSIFLAPDSYFPITSAMASKYSLPIGLTNSMKIAALFFGLDRPIFWTR